MLEFNETPDIRLLDPLKPSMEIGIIPKTGQIILDSNFNLMDIKLPYFMLIRVGSGGNLLVQGIDGNVIPYLEVLDGQWLVGEGNMILSTTTINTHTYTTTCNNIVVYGGQ